MKIKYKNYTYFNGSGADEVINSVNSINPFYSNDINEEHKFKKDKFNNLIAERRFVEAADYAAQYYFDDIEIQREYENDIINLKRNGAILSGIYSRIDANYINEEEKQDVLDKIQFADAVFADGGLDMLRDNKYAVSFNNLKRHLGDEIIYNKGVTTYGRKAKTIAVTFEPEKQYGLFGIDFLAKDNDNNINAFYDRSGLTEKELKNNGIDVIYKDGKTTLQFDKANKYANRILLNIREPISDDAYNPSLSFGSASNGNSSYSIKYFDNKGDEIKGDRSNFLSNYNLNSMISAVKQAAVAKDNVFKKLDIETKDYSSSVAPWIDDKLMELKAKGLPDDEYNKQARAVAGNIFKTIKSADLTKDIVYSNYFNDEDTDFTLEQTNPAQSGELVNIISTTAPKDMQVDAMVANGQIGALITIDAKEDTNGNLKRKRIQIFVPGLLQNECQKRINRDTKTRAIQEINSMIDWGYSYKLRNGSSIHVNQTGDFIKSTKDVAEIIDKDTAIRDINRDMILTDTMAKLKYNYMNSKGELINLDEYERMARLTSLKAASELYNGAVKRVDKGEEFYAINGYRYSASDIFNRNIDEDTVQFDTWKIIQDIYSMYDQIMDDLTYYR